ncbi:MAG: hypothetical protein AMXMBFR84_49140 [Candidatus Hydrogenedentota bacterium]
MTLDSLDAQIGRAVSQQLPPWCRRIVIGREETASFSAQLEHLHRTVVRLFTYTADDVSEFDAVCGQYDTLESVKTAASKSISLLHAYGLWVLVHVRPLDRPDTLIQSDAEQWLIRLGLIPYFRTTLSTAKGDAIEEIGYVVGAVKAAYNPIAHARSLFDAGYPTLSYDVLARVPAELLETPEDRAAVKAEMQLCLLSWDRVSDPKDRLARFYLSQAHFYEAVSEAPSYRLPYIIQSEFWRDLGDADMAERIVSSYNYLFGATEPVLPNSLSSARCVNECPAVRTYSGRPYRILYLIHPRPHYGLDVLFDGLCSLVGDINVTDFPYKPWLHGELPREHAHYPCTFNRTGPSVPLEQVVYDLRSGHYDFVLTGSAHLGLGLETITAIRENIGQVPVFVVDAEDDPRDNFAQVQEALGVPGRAYFKREMLCCHDYPEPTFPLPFAYPDRLIPSDSGGSRTNPLFWAGHRKFGLRRPYLDHIERRLGLSLSQDYPQNEYREAMLASLVGLNVFGLGYDTVRYWELPAHGCMLLSDRLPIHIPHNFVDGYSAVFFDTAHDLDEKLDFYLAHPAEATDIAGNGHQQLRQFHSGSARAGQLLGWIEWLLSVS